jgi:pyruvate dehydrogenase E2 component (dihydrolipoamide acetyltransferase)
MPIEITVPRLGWSMEEGRFLGWLKEPGAAVTAGEPLFTLENDKAAQDVESLDDGILAIPADAPRPGDTVLVGARLGFLLAAGETVPDEPANGKPEQGPVTPDPVMTAPAAGAAAAALPETGSPAGSPPASPRARAAAARLGVDVAAVAPGGTAGRVRERDVVAAAAHQTAGSSRPAAGPGDLAAASLRRTIAERMMASLANTAPVTLTCRADATNLVSLRGQFKAAGTGAVPAYTDIIAKLVALALEEHPALAARWEDGRVVLPEAIHIGIAVDTEAGLVVPVIRDVPGLPLVELARRSRALVAAARARTASPADLRGGSFTITNLGSFGIESFTPIINHPETAVLGLGRIGPEAVPLADGGLGVRERVALSLTFDHRVVDGAPAARFLQAVVRGIENPAARLLDVAAGPGGAAS